MNMKPFHKRKSRRLLIIVLMATMGVVLFDPARFLREERGPKVVAFVIDSASSMMKKERNILDLFENLTHGQVVCNVLRRYGEPDELQFHNVDDAQGAVDGRRYLDALSMVKSYLRDNPDNRVVVNISLGSYSPKPEETRLIEDIFERGAIVVAAAGNDGVKDSIYPAALKGVLSVGASANGVRAVYSNYGKIDFFADGTYQTTQAVSLPSNTGMENQSRVVKLNGTSFAAPRVSGLIVKLLQLEPSLEKQQIIDILRNTSDPVLGFEQGSVNRLNALATISDRYAVLREARHIFFVILETMSFIVLVGVGLLIIVPLPEFAFRVLFPFRWTAIKIQKIDRIMAGKIKSSRDIRYLINCLFPGYGELFERAGAALRDIGEPAVKYLIRAYPYKASDEFGDFKTCVHNLIEEIGGREAEEFLQAEQEIQEELER
ncbi:MAG: S8 family serine peptidase [Sedimentisphaerales bacterium]|nr:S8 family serine peptidase [Sedimentisphaerales bacterium]